MVHDGLRLGRTIEQTHLGRHFRQGQRGATSSGIKMFKRRRLVQVKQHAAALAQFDKVV